MEVWIGENCSVHDAVKTCKRARGLTKLSNNATVINSAKEEQQYCDFCKEHRDGASKENAVGGKLRSRRDNGTTAR